MREEAYVKIKIEGLSNKLDSLHKSCKEVCLINTFVALYNEYEDYKTSKVLFFFKRKTVLSFLDYTKKLYAKYVHVSKNGGFFESSYTTWYRSKDTSGYEIFVNEIKLLAKFSDSPEIFLNNKLIEYFGEFENKANKLQKLKTKHADLLIQEKEAYDFIVGKY